MDKKTIGSLPSVAIIIGSVLGTGIFFAPSMVAKFSTHLGVVAALWGLGALLCLLGADIYGRLGELLPEGGGQYVYLKKGHGRGVAAVYGWLSLLVLCPTMIAGMCLYLASHLSYFDPNISTISVKLGALISAAILTILNYRGIRAAGKIQTTLVLFQILTILAMVLGLIFISSRPTLSPLQQMNQWPEFNGLHFGLLAFAAILWSFEGFNTLTFVTDEVKKGKKRIRCCLFAGTFVIFALYLVINVCAILFVPPDLIAETPNIAVLLNEMSFGAVGKNITLLLTVIGLLTTGHAAVLIGPRITAKLSEDGFLFRRYGRLNRIHTSPNNALSLQLFITSAFILAGSFESLVTMFVVVNWFFYLLVAMSLLKVLPDEETHFKIKASVYTFSSLILIFIGAQMYQNPELSAVGIGLVCILMLAANSLVRRSKSGKWASPFKPLVDYAKRINLL
ncbi:MAG: hypothetical protein CL677_06720 [Bdellovibrionaceae bacterium]|nr:hypothetical protein [Pseudobdellovibrionaceae bacterium]|tara:strand:+ start:110313 stop:111665 length:1353 start_codon:yes stop_codon:yes gene_type:complete